MSRITDESTFLFPVKLEPVFILDLKRVGQGSLFDPHALQPDYRGDYREVKYRAVTDLERREIFAIVSKEYRLIENREVYDIAKTIFCRVFSFVEEKDIQVFNVVMPKSRSFCHVDLIHRAYAVNFLNREVWLPFLRFTNSYNKTKPLRFDLGFCRALCDNGVIFESETISMKYYHTKSEIPQYRFDVPVDKLSRLEEDFISFLHTLKNVRVDGKYFLPVTCKALGIKFENKSLDYQKREKEQNRLARFVKEVEPLVWKYIEEHGQTAYAVLNLITDFSSRPSFFTSPANMIDPLQKRAGSWVKEFVHEVKKPSFDLDLYLGETLSWFNR